MCGECGATGQRERFGGGQRTDDCGELLLERAEGHVGVLPLHR